MSKKLISDVMANCAVGFEPANCDTDVKDDCVMRVTLDCFKKMLDHGGVLAQKGVQTGGGLNTDSILPYLRSRKITALEGHTSLPAGILATVYSVPLPPRVKFDDIVYASSLLDPAAIRSVNRML